MINLRFFFGLFLFSLSITGSLWAQDYRQMRNEIVEKQKQTRAEIVQLNQQIKTYEERLRLADRKYEALYQKYKDLNHLIALQDQKLSKLQKEQEHIQSEIEVTSQSLNAKHQELERLVENYKKTLRYVYKYGRTSQLALIFSSSSINQMLVRSFYLKKFNSYREKQVKAIRQTEKELKKTKAQLVEARSKNENILSEIRKQKQQLAEKKQLQEKNVALLRENRNEIKQKLQEVQQQRKKLNNTLSTLSRREEEIRKAREERLRRMEAERKQKLAAARKIKNDVKRSREVAKYSEPVTIKNFMASERLEEIETHFAGSKGQLPWPVDSRTISEHFGNRRHPVYGTVTPSLGIEIVTDPQSTVRVVHDGYVIDIRPIPGYGDVVVVKHGRFITAYGNLSQIMVQKNEILRQGDIIGLSGDSDSTRGESLFFLVRENNDNRDPEKWLQNETVTSNY